MEWKIRVEHVEARPAAVVRCRTARADLVEAIPQACAELWDHARGALPDLGRTVVLYRGAGPVLDVEVGVEVESPFKAREPITCSQIPAGTAAATTYMGPYERLPEVHAAVRRWCARNRRVLAGVCWEVYGCWDRDAARRRTDVYYLLNDEHPAAP
jgi:effector-binding domain-containing protein